MCFDHVEPGTCHELAVTQRKDTACSRKEIFQLASGGKGTYDVEMFSNKLEFCPLILQGRVQPFLLFLKSRSALKMKETQILFRNMHVCLHMHTSLSAHFQRAYSTSYFMI